MADGTDPAIRHQVSQKHATKDKYGQKYLEATGKMQKNIPHMAQNANKQPPGGFDDTPIPDAPPGYTVKFTFHKAVNLPFADLNSLSSDPYIVATLKTDLPRRHKQDPDMKWRTVTLRRTTEPEWNNEWIVGNVPASGFSLKCRLYDEDPADHDDRLGNVTVRVNSVSEQWSGIDQLAYKIKKRMASKRAYLFRGCAAVVHPRIHMSGELIISAQVLGRTESEHGGQLFTVGPCQWSKHLSPLIGRLAGIKDTEEEKDGKKIERYNFQAVQMQLAGPVPAPLYHRYVEFKSFVAGMFGSKGFSGKILNRALHHQHARIYNYDRSTAYGVFEKPCIDMTKKFLDFVHYDQGGRIFTYVITLHGQFRFTETGKEFGIDLLSKHTMHADVDQYIAFSGEFFIRRLKHPRSNKSDSPDPQSATLLPPAPDPEQQQNSEATHSSRPASSTSTSTSSPPTTDPSKYELIIDNDSGTYRPNSQYFPELKSFLSSNFPSLRIVTLDCQKDADLMSKLKDEQRKRKSESGKKVCYLQRKASSSASSLSSSDEEELEAIGTQERKQGLAQKIKDPKKTFMKLLNDAAGPSGVEDLEKGQDHGKGEHDEKMAETTTANEKGTGTNSKVNGNIS